MKKTLNEEINRIKNLNNQISGVNEQLLPAVSIPKLIQKLLPNVTSVTKLLNDVANQMVLKIQENTASPTIFSDMKQIMVNGFTQNPNVKTSFDKYIDIVFNKQGEIKDIFIPVINPFKVEMGDNDTIPREGVEVAKAAIKEAYGDESLNKYLNVFNKVTAKLGMNTTSSMTQLDPSLGLPKSFTPEQMEDYAKVTGIDTSYGPPSPSGSTGETQTSQVAEMRKKGKGVIIEGADYKGVYADAFKDNIRFLKDGTLYTYKLIADKGIEISIGVRDIKKEGGVIMMTYDAGLVGGKGTEPLGEDKLNDILPKLGQDKIYFKNKNNDNMVLKKQ
jgi:hypothetical protein